MDKLIIAKSGVAYAGTNAVPGTLEGAFTPDLLAPGAFGLYGFHRYSDSIERFALITHTAATSSATPASYTAKDTDYNGTQVQFYLGTQAAIYREPSSLPTSQPKQSSPIQLKGIRRVTGTPYVPAALEGITITFPALPGTTTIYDTYTIKVTKVPNTRSVFSWTFQAVGIFANLAAVATAIVAQYTNITTQGGPNGVTLPFTLAVSGSTIILTAKNYGDAFTVASDDLSYPSTYTFSTPLVVGSGNFYQVYKKESDTLGDQGFLDQIDRRVVPVTRLADPAALYDTYVFDFVNTLDLKNETDDTFSNQEGLTVYIPQGSAQATELEAILTVFASRNLITVPLALNNTAQTVNGTTTTTTA